MGNDVMSNGVVAVLIGTRKGAFILRSDRERANWKLEGPIYLGSVIHHMLADPRDKSTIVMAASTGHLGPTILHSTDFGKTWREAERPPAFAKAPEGQKGRTVKNTFWLTAGHASEPGVWYVGTSPHGLFRSEDAGATWDEVKGFNEHPKRGDWGDDEEAGTPAGPILHSINIDPRDAKHMYVGLSTGGVLESLDGGADWKPLNKGCAADFLPDQTAEFGHDPHCVFLHPQQPDRLYQQNHCGIYRLDRPSDEWVRIGDNMPKETGDIGFPVTLHPRDPDTVWVFPMDGTDVWPRTCPGGRAAVYRTRDAGATWECQNRGLPGEHAYLTVLRQAMGADCFDPVGLYFGSTNGEVWASLDEGENWSNIARYLPHIYSLEVVELEA